MSETFDADGMSDALKIARWCWPDLPWQSDPGGDPALVYALAFSDPRHSDKIDEHARSFEDWADVADAERVLIERGLAEEYGRALDDQLLHLDDRWMDWTEWECLARTATAPLEARVRAMAAVIRSLSGTPPADD